MSKFVNLTPHALVLRTADGDITVPPSGQQARVATKSGAVSAREGIPVLVASPTSYGSVEGIPEPVEGTFYLVSALVLGRVSRPDVFAPGTGPQDGAVREPDTLPDGSPNPRKGQIIAVTRLIAAV